MKRSSENDHMQGTKSTAINMIKRAQKRAKENNLPFDISIDDLHFPVYCPVLGIKLELNGKGNAPSLDKINPSKGYVKGNIAIMSHRANMLKSNANIDEVRKLLCWMEQNAN